MKIAQLQAKAFRGLPDDVYDFTLNGRVSPLSVTTGAARSGKTSLLSAIASLKEAVAPTGVPLSSAWALRRGEERGYLEATWELDAAEADAAGVSDVIAMTRWSFSTSDGSADAPAGLRKLFARFDCSGEVAKLEWIPEELDTSTVHGVPKPPALRAQRAMPSADKYGWVRSALTQTMLGDAVALRGKLRAQGMVVEGETEGATERYQRAVQAVTPHLRLASLVDFGNGPEPTFAIRQQGGESGSDIPWSALSGTDRRALSLAIAATYLGLSRSIVLWDSPDRLFGRDRFIPVLEALSGLLPHAQLVVGLETGSPVPPAAKSIPLCG